MGLALPGVWLQRALHNLGLHSPPAGASLAGELDTRAGEPDTRPTPRPRRRAERRPPNWASATRRCASTRASSASKPCARPSAALSRSPSSKVSARTASSLSSRPRATSSCFFSVPRASSREPSRPRSRDRNSASCSCSFLWDPWSWGRGEARRCHKAAPHSHLVPTTLEGGERTHVWGGGAYLNLLICPCRLCGMCSW